MKKFLPKSLNNPQGFTFGTKANDSRSEGFTLVELLVVITIIAILSVVGITLFTGAQKGARDAKRRSDVDAISNALEVHFKDFNAPCSATDATPYCAAADNTFFAGGILPTNTSPGGAAYSIIITAARTTYTVCALLENNNGNSSSAGDGTTFTSASGALATYYCRKNQQ